MSRGRGLQRRCQGGGGPPPTGRRLHKGVRPAAHGRGAAPCGRRSGARPCGDGEAATACAGVKKRNYADAEARLVQAIQASRPRHADDA